jgi:hypothetical protein
MKKVNYNVKLESELYDEVEMTSEGLIIEWYDDQDNRKLKIECKRKLRGDEDYDD